MKSILDPTFCYTPSMRTDISKTFARIRREQRDGMRIVAEPDAALRNKLSPITRCAARNAR